VTSQVVGEGRFDKTISTNKPGNDESLGSVKTNHENPEGIGVSKTGIWGLNARL